MTVFAYKCRTCGGSFDSTSRSLTTCPHCLSSEIRRDYSTIQIGGGGFDPHFNHAVGAYVDSSRDFDEKLKIRGEQAGSTFVRIDPGDMPRPTKEDEVFDTRERTIHDMNINPESLR